MRPRRGQPAGRQLSGERSREPMEDEAERLQLLRWWFDGESQDEAFGGGPRPERVDLLAARTGVDPRALLPEPRDERRAGELRHRADPAQPEAGEPGPDVGVLGEEAGWVGGEERGLATGRDEDRFAGAGVDRGDGRGEAGPGDAGTDRGAGRGRDSAGLRQGRASTPARRSARTGSAPHNGSRPSAWTSNSPNDASAGSVVPASPGLNAARASNAASAAVRSASGSGSTKTASGASRCALPSGIPRRTPSARASRFASMTVPGSHGRPPSTSGPVGKGSEARAAASARGRCGR